MSFTNPVITGGGASAQSIFDTTTTARHRVGTRGQTVDGRSFYYAENRSTALVSGVLLAAPAISVDFDDLATNTATVGATSVNVTPVGTAVYAVNQLAGGFLSINSGTTGAGTQYIIKSHPVTTAATAFDIQLEDPIRVAFNADTTATVVPNPYGGVVVSPTGAAFVVGATQIAVGTGTDAAPIYFWAQTWGHATILAGAALDVVGHALVKGTGGTGETLGFVDAAADVSQIIGINRFTSVDADYMPVYLQIAP